MVLFEGGISLDMSGFLATRYAIDLRSLALFRIVLALCVLGDLCGRASDLTAHYTDSGILRRADLFLLNHLPPDWPFAFGVAGGTWWSQAVLFLLAAAAAGALLVGYRARLAALIAWFLLTAIQMRQPYVLAVGDGLMRWFLLWSCLLPVGESLSLDATLASGPISDPPRRVSVSGLAWWLQIATILIFLALSMWGDLSWRSGHGLAELLDQDLLATGLGERLRYAGSLTDLLSRGLPLLLAVLTLACLTPVATTTIRATAVFVLVLSLLAACLFLDVSRPAILMGGALLSFIPSATWARFAIRAQEDSITLLIPEGCDACARWSHATLAFTGLRYSCSVMSLGRRESLPEHVWHIESSDGRHGSGLDGLGSLLKASPWWWWTAPWLGNSLIQRTAAVLWPSIHDNAPAAQSNDGAIARCGRVGRPTLAWLLLLSALWTTLRATPSAEPATLATQMLHIAGLPAEWSVRALQRSYTGWFSIPGTLVNGREVELLGAGGTLPTIEQAELANRSLRRRPAQVITSLRNQRWRRFFAHSVDSGTREQFLFYGRYLCREWNRLHSDAEQLRSFSFVMMRRAVQHESRVYTTEDYERSELWNHDCFG